MALKAPRETLGFMGAPALGPPYPGFQVSPSSALDPNLLDERDTYFSGAFSGGHKGVGNPQPHQHHVPRTCAEWVQESRPLLVVVPLCIVNGEEGSEGGQGDGTEATQRETIQSPAFLSFFFGGPET